MSEQSEHQHIKIVFRDGQEYSCFVDATEIERLMHDFTDRGVSKTMLAYTYKVYAGEARQLRILMLSFTDVLYIG